jgi:hypothetical protein
MAINKTIILLGVLTKKKLRLIYLVLMTAYTCFHFLNHVASNGRAINK